MDTTQTPTIESVADEAYRAMERATREDGSQYVRLRDDAPEWVRTMVYDAHSDILPDDWRYATIRDAIEAIMDSGDDEDRSHEFADDADVYNSDLLAWVGSHGSRPGYVDEARDELGEPRDFYHGLQMGQYLERAEVYDAVLEAISSRLGDLEDEAE
jgi:hypothetical protein